MARSAVRRRKAAALTWPGHVRRATGRTPARRLANVTAAGRQPAMPARHFLGVLAEFAALVLLVLKGYRILDRRHRNRYGELDLVAVRGNRLAFVEVKYRTSIAIAAASISDRQATRIGEAAEHWVWRHPAYHDHEIGLDAVLVAPLRLPRHVANALQPA